MSRSTVLQGSFAALLVLGILIWYASNYLARLFHLIKCIIAFNHPERFDYVKIYGVIMPLENTPIENYLQETGDPVLNFSSVYAPTVNEDATGVPAYKVGIAKINRPFLIKTKSNEIIETIVSGYTNRQLRLNRSAFLVGRWQDKLFCPYMVSDKAKSRLGLAEIMGLVIIMILITFSISTIIHFGKVIWGILG